jgi:hypothetical protein
VRDFQGAVETVLWFPCRRHFHRRRAVDRGISNDRIERDRIGGSRTPSLLLAIVAAQYTPRH